MLTVGHLVVDTGCIRFSLPSDVNDATEYEFVRGSERVSIAPVHLPPGAEASTIVEDRVRQLTDAAKAIDRTASVVRLAIRDRWTEEASEVAVLHVTAGRTVVHYGVVAGGTRDGRHRLLSHSCLDDDATEDGRRRFEDRFRVIAGTLDLGKKSSTLPPPGWRVRFLGDAAIALPDDFSCPEAFEFSKREWTILLTQGTRRPRPWRPYFPPSSETTVIERTTSAIEVGQPAQRLDEEVRRVSSVSSQVPPDGGGLMLATTERIIHELTIRTTSGQQTHVFGAATPESHRRFEFEWAALMATLRCDSPAARNR